MPETTSPRPPGVVDPRRLAVLRETGILDSLPEQSFDRLTRLAARVVGAPVALVSLVDEDRQFFKSCVGLPEPWASARQTPLSHSFCQYVVAADEPLVVEDARLDPVLRDNLAIRDLGVIAYAGWPIRARDGTPLGSFCVIDSQPRAWTDRELADLADIAASVNAEVALREAVLVERRAREQAQRANARLRFLAEASALLSGTLDRERILQDLAGLAVPALADWCVIDVADGGRLERVAIAHGERNPQVPPEPLVDYPLRKGMPEFVEVFRSGRPELVAPVTEGWLRRKARDARHLQLLTAMRLDSVAVVPLVAKAKVLGVMTFAMGDPERRYTEEDLEVFVELGRHAALAVENSRLYAERDNVARTLQRSLLPPALPQVPGFDLGVAYAPSGAGNEVGGDFYDVFRNPWGDWVIAIGDVCGKGVDAAITTGLARHTMRAAAMDHRDPVEILKVLNQVLFEDPAVGGADRFCSLLLGTLEQVNGYARLTLTSAGHPAPILRRADGRLEEPVVSGTLLGLFEDAEFSSTRVRLGPADVLVAYTDGVAEARAGDALFGGGRLSRLVAGLGGRSARLLADEVLDAVLRWQGGQRQDDMAILVVGRVAVAHADPAVTLAGAGTAADMGDSPRS